MSERRGLEGPKGARFIVPLRFLGAVATLVAAFSFAAPASFAQFPSDSSVAQRRAQHLRYGINLSEWFAQVYDSKGYTKEHFESWNTAEDIAMIKAMGFDHVRLSVNPQPMVRRKQADQIPADYLGYLDAAVKMILDQGLAVMIDAHPDSDLKEKLATDNDFVEQFADFWRGLALHYSNLDPDLVFFEVLNEPEGRDSYRWYGIQARLAVAIRESAPRHTIVVAGARWSDDDDLLFIEPLRSQYHLQLSFLLTACVYASGRDVGTELLALCKGPAVSIERGERAGSGGGRPGPRKKTSGRALWDGPMERGADGRGV